jgi:hypothetical protein
MITRRQFLPAAAAAFSALRSSAAPKSVGAHDPGMLALALLLRTREAEDSSLHHPSSP